MLTAPLLRLADAVGRVSRDHDYSVRIDVERGNEPRDRIEHAGRASREQAVGAALAVRVIEGNRLVQEPLGTLFCLHRPAEPELELGQPCQHIQSRPGQLLSDWLIEGRVEPQVLAQHVQ